VKRRGLEREMSTKLNRKSEDEKKAWVRVSEGKRDRELSQSVTERGGGESKQSYVTLSLLERQFE